MAAIDKVKILVVGDSGVGKSSLTHLIAHKEPVSKASWTVGCSVEVKLHEYKEGTPEQKSYFVELWDVGGSSSHSNARGVFYNSVRGIILVHDLTNRRSEENLQKWLTEVLNKDQNVKNKRQSDDYDPEHFAGLNQIPVLVIGTKLDLANRNRLNRRKNVVSEECGADEIFLNCHDARSLAPGTSAVMKLNRFFDKVIQIRYHSSSTMAEKRKVHSVSSSPRYIYNE